VVYIQQPAPQPKVIVQRSTGCADGCVIVIAVGILVFCLLFGGCAVLGFAEGNAAVEAAREKSRMESSSQTHETAE